MRGLGQCASRHRTSLGQYPVDMSSCANNHVPRAHGGLAGAFERGIAAKRAWTTDGTLLSAAAFANRRGVSLDELAVLEVRDEVFSIVVDDAHWYPSELLNLSPSDAAAVCSELADEDPSRKLIFLMRTHGALGGTTVAAAVAEGCINLAIELAKAWRYS